MSNKTKSRFLRNRTLSRFAALGGTALIISAALGLGSAVALAANSSGHQPTTQVGQNEWSSTPPSNPANVFAASGDDDNFVTTTVANADEGYGGFGITIPGGSIIDGIAIAARAKSTDANGCDLSIRLSGNAGSTWTGYQTQELGTTEVAENFGGAANTWGFVWDPTMLTNSNFRIEIRNIDDAGCTDGSTTSVDSISITVTYRTINSGTANAAISNTVCDQADFNFVIDMSGSIAAQGSAPSNLPDLKAGIADFVDTFQASGDGRYSGTKFNGDLGAVGITSGYQSAATFKTAVAALTGPAGLTPTGAGITSGAGNTANDRAGVQNIMFVVTDGSPNVPPGSPLDSPPTWLTAANAAIAAANAARSSFVVKAVYLRTDDDPGDTTLPFSNPAGDALWASNVMTEIGGGSFLLGDFSDFATDLLNTLHCNPDLEVTKTAANSPITAGATASFTMKVENIGKGTANDVVLTDNLPAGISWSVNPAVTGCSIDTALDPDKLTCNFGTLASGASKTVTITGLTDGGDCGPLPNTASATASNEPGSVLGNNSDSDSITVICAALDLTKTADAVSVSAGSQIGFRVTIANTGAGTATGLSFTDALPGGTGVNWSIESSDAGWSITGVAPNQSLVYAPTTLAGNSDTEVHVISGTTGASCKAYVNNASVSATNDGSDTAQATTTVQCPALDLTKTADNLTVSAGSQIGFTVTIANTGAGTATGIAFTDNLPGGPGINWSISPASAGWSITGVAPNQVLAYAPTTLAGNTSTSVHVISATTSASCAAYLNSASVTAGNTAGDTAQATTTVQCPALDLTKTADNLTVSAGSQIGFTVTIANTGAGTATGIAFTDNLPGGPGINWSISPASAGWSITGVAPNQVLAYAPTTLAGNTSTSVHVISATTSASCAAYLNSASVTAGNTAGDTAQATTTVQCPALDLTKTADNLTVSAGSQIGFTVTIANTGAGTATGIAFTDNLPGGPGINWSISPASAGWSITGVAPNQVLAYAPTTLAGNTSTSVHVISATTSASCAAYLNSASVTAGNTAGDTAQATTTVQCADIDINKVADDDSVSAGDDIGFTITVTNTGEGTATGVHVSDELPTDAGLNWSAGPVTGPDAAGASCAIALGFLTCDAASLPKDGSFSVHISSPTTGATVATSPVENTAEVTTTNDGDDESTDEVEVLGAHIAIDKEADDAVVNAGDQIGFKVTISNSGPGQAKGVHVTDTLPTDGGLDWSLDDDAGGLCALDSGVVTCDKDTLDMGETIVFHVTSDTTAATAEDSPVENDACVETTNDGEACDGDQTEVLGADIQIVKIADDDSVSAGDDIGFTITVFNNGEGTATGVHVSDELPTDLGLNWSAGPVTGPDAAGASCAIALGFLTCDAASLPKDGSFSVHISSPTTWATAASSPVENTAEVTTTNDGDDESTDEVEVLAPAITIDKEADDEVVNAGESVGFKVTISNSGPGIAKGVLVTDTLPTDAGLSWILDDDAGGLCKLETGVVTCEKDTLGVGETIVFHVTSTTTAATVADSPVSNEACVTAENQAGGACDDDDTEILGAAITIAKEADDDQVAVGDTIGFKVTISNSGPGIAKGVHVTDTLPTDVGLSWILDDNAGGLCALAAGIVTCDKDTLDVGETIVFHVTSTTTAATAETSPVENTACVETSNDGEACAGDEVGVSSLVIDKSNNAPIDEELEIPTAPVGSTVTYTLDYTFTGDPVTNGLIEDVLPEGVEYIVDSATDSDEFLFVEYVTETRTLIWKAEEVTKSGSLQYQVKVLEEAEGFGPLTNVATIVSDQTEEDDATSDIFVPTIPEAETSKPTPPQTDAIVGEGAVAGPGISLLVMFAILGGLIVGLAFVTPVPEVVRRRNRR